MITTHLAYSDESQHNIGRYRGICMVSLPAEQGVRIVNEIEKKLVESDVTEVKWKKIKGARDRFAAIKLIEICVQEAIQGHLRLDVIIWDTKDERHKIQGRDDQANLQNMYIQLFKNVLKKRWPINSTWQIFPDENSIIDWDYIQNTLANTDRFTSQKPNLLGDEWLSLRTNFNIYEIAEVCSRDIFLAQVADLFSGMGVFSYEHFGVYQSWERKNSEQPELIITKEESFTSKEEEHSRTLNEFKKETTKHRLGISLKSSQGLKTHNPSGPINFWLYQPQHKYDKAPIRKKE
jgi:hypothetical protein